MVCRKPESGSDGGTDRGVRSPYDGGTVALRIGRSYRSLVRWWTREGLPGRVNYVLAIVRRHAFRQLGDRPRHIHPVSFAGTPAVLVEDRLRRHHRRGFFLLRAACQQCGDCRTTGEFHDIHDGLSFPCSPLFPKGCFGPCPSLRRHGDISPPISLRERQFLHYITANLQDSQCMI